MIREPVDAADISTLWEKCKMRCIQYAPSLLTRVIDLRWIIDHMGVLSLGSPTWSGERWYGQQDINFPRYEQRLDSPKIPGIHSTRKWVAIWGMYRKVLVDFTVLHERFWHLVQWTFFTNATLSVNEHWGQGQGLLLADLDLFDKATDWEGSIAHCVNMCSATAPLQGMWSRSINSETSNVIL